MGTKMSSDNDHNTWVYHALHEAKVVKYSEALKLYKQGWRDSPRPETLFKGIRGKWYWLILLFKKIFTNPSNLSPLELIGVIGSIASIIGVFIALFSL